MNLSKPEIKLKRKAMAQYQTQQRIMGDFLSPFVRSSECFTLLKPDNSNGMEAAVEHWPRAQKTFDNLHAVGKTFDTD